MPILLEFVAFSDAELQWLVAALQAARTRLPWQPQSLRVHDGVWILRVLGPVALYHEIASTRERAFATRVPNGPGQGAAAEMPANNKNSRRDAKSGGEKDAPDSASVVKSALAKKGKYAGANWQGHSFARQDLRGADFSAADLRGADFHGANLQGASFRNAQLGLPPAEPGVARWRLPAYQLLLDKTRFWTLAAASLLVLAVGLALLLPAGYAGASLAGLMWVIGLLLLDQRHASWRQKLSNGGTRFDAANLLQADFSGAYIGLVNFEQAQLQQVRWLGAVWQMPLYFSDPVFSQRGVPALLAGQRAQLDFSGVDLSAQNLAGLDLSGFDFSAANLQVANLSGCNLQGARLAAANLCGANLTLANLSGADLSGWHIDHQTGLTQVACDFWYDLPRVAAANLPAAVLPEPLPPERWPPDCGILRPGEFAHLIAPRVNGIRFLAANLALCRTRLDLLLHLAKTMPIRLQQIHFDTDPSAYGIASLAVPVSENGTESPHDASVEAGRSQAGKAAMGYQIEVEADPGVDTLALCQAVWQHEAAPAMESDRLLAVLGTLAG